MITYNLQNGFKCFIMPEEYSKCKKNTLRRVFFKVLGNLAGSSRYKHIKFDVDKRLKEIILFVNKRLNQFSPQLQ